MLLKSLQKVELRTIKSTLSKIKKIETNAAKELEREKKKAKEQGLKISEDFSLQEIKQTLSTEEMISRLKYEYGQENLRIDQDLSKRSLQHYAASGEVLTKEQEELLRQRLEFQKTINDQSITAIEEYQEKIDKIKGHTNFDEL